MSNQVVSAEDLLAAVKADPSKVLNLVKKGEDKAYKGTRFLNAHWTVGPVTTQGFFGIRNVTLSRGVADPDDKQDKRNEFDGTHDILESVVSQAGAYGEAVLLLNPHWKALIGPHLGTRKCHDLLQLTLSEENKDPEKRGKPIEDPIVRWQVDFTKFSDKHPVKLLQGRQKTQVLDFRKPYIEKVLRKDPLTGEETIHEVTKYRPATVVNKDGVAEPLNAKNMHLFFTRGSTIHYMRLMQNSAALSQAWGSLPALALDITAEPGQEEGWSDDAAAVIMTPASLTAALTVTPTAAPQPTVIEPATPTASNDTVTTPAPDTNDADIAGLLDQL